MKRTRSFSTFSVALSAFLCGILLGISGISISAGTKGSARFSDVPIGSYYDDAVGELSELGIFTGHADGSFKGGDFVRRAELAVALQRLRNEIKGISPAARESNSTTSNVSLLSAEERAALRATARQNISGDSATTSTDSSGRQLIVNTQGSVRFTIDRYTVHEDKGLATITVVRTGGKEGDVSVEYELKNGTAIGGDDYLVASGVLQFDSGETSKSFPIQIVDDTDQEGDETFTVTLIKPTGGVEMGTPREAVVTIEDNESSSSGGTDSDAGVFEFSALSYSTGEDAGSIDITVRRIGGSKGAVSVDYTTRDITAKSPSDYSDASDTLDFADGDTSKTFTVTISDDANTEGNEKVQLVLRSPTGGSSVSDTDSVELTIIDDEVLANGTGSLRLSDSDYIVGESAGELIVIVERVSGSRGSVSVDYNTNSGNAKPGQDYTDTSGTMTFANGETAKTFVVPILDDDKDDPDETFSVTLSNPRNGATISGTQSATVTIQQ